MYGDGINVRGTSPTLAVKLISAVLLLCFAAGTPARAADVLAGARPDLITALLPTVVNIATSKAQRASTPPPAVASASNGPTDVQPTVKNFVGSGFIIDTSGLIVTNYHVVQDAFDITVTLSDGTRLQAKTLSASRLADIAVLKIETKHPLKAAHWGDSDKLQVGDQVFAAGNPFGLGLSVSAGIVSGLNRDIQNSPYDDLIQTDATINHGNSGGPLFDMNGAVIGVNSTIISPSQGSSGLGFAIPAKSASFVVGRLLTYGWVRPAWIGIKVQEVTPQMGEALGMADARGSIVAWVRPEGPAARAGLTVGDVLLRFNGLAPSDERALLRDIAHTDIGETITLTIRRDGQEQDVVVAPEAWPRNQWEALDAPLAVVKPKLAIPPDLGLKLSDLLAEDRTKLDLDAYKEGVLITDVAPNSGPAQQGIKEGDVILRVQDKPVMAPEDVLDKFDAARSEKRDYVLVLVWPKVREVPGPKWYALEVGQNGD